MRNKLFKIKAILNFLPSSQGGRKEKFASGYRPHFKFIPEMAKSRAIMFKGVEFMKPSENMLLDIYFVDDNYLGENFKEGAEFSFYEGEFKLGIGEVVKIYGFDYWNI